MGGFFGGFAGAFGQQFSQMIQQKKMREMQAHTIELNAIGHLLDKPDLTDSAREELTQRYMDTAGKMSPHASGILGRLLGRPPAQAAPRVQNGSFSEDRLQAPAPEFTDTGAKYRSALPPVPGAAAEASPSVLSEYQGADDFGSAETSPAAAPVTRPPVQASAPSPGLPPVPTTGTAGVPGRMFKTEEQKRASKVADATAAAGVQTEALKTRGANATAERVNLEKQLEPLREKQRQAQEVSMQARQVAVQQARNEGRMVKAGVGPKPNGLPWEYVQSTAYADGSVVETPVSPPAHVQTLYQMAAAKVAQSGEPPTVENLQKAWNELMTVKSQKLKADAKGADARATQTEMRNKGTLPAPNRTPGAGTKPPGPKDFQKIEDTKNAGWKKSNEDWYAQNIAIDKLDRGKFTDEQKKALKAENDARRKQQQKDLQTKYERSIRELKGGSGTGGGKKVSMEWIKRAAQLAFGGDIEKAKAEAKAKGYIIE